MDESGGGDECVAIGVRVGDMKVGAAARDGSVNGENALFECRKDAVFEPGPQDGSLRWIAALDAENSDFKFENRDGGNVECGGRDAGSPAADVRVGLAGL